MEKNYKSLGFILIIYIPVTFLAFYKTYFGQFPDFDKNIDFFIHVHAFIASVWLGLLIIQPLLIRYKRYDLHRQFDIISFTVLG